MALTKRKSCFVVSCMAVLWRQKNEPVPVSTGVRVRSHCYMKTWVTTQETTHAVAQMSLSKLLPSNCHKLPFIGKQSRKLRLMRHLTRHSGLLTLNMEPYGHGELMRDEICCVFLFLVGRQQFIKRGTLYNDTLICCTGAWNNCNLLKTIEKLEFSHSQGIQVQRAPLDGLA